MTLTIRKPIVLGMIGAILLLGNILFVASWLAEKGVVDWARSIRSEYLTGTAITTIVVLLILLVSPRRLLFGVRQQGIIPTVIKLSYILRMSCAICTACRFEINSGMRRG